MHAFNRYYTCLSNMSPIWITAVNEALSSEKSSETEFDSVLDSITAGMVEGREADFSQFCRRYSQALHRYCLKIVKGDDAGSYELHQQVLIRIARYPKHISDEKALWRWMSRVVRTTQIDIHRKQKRYGAAMRAYWEHVTTQPKNPQSSDASLSTTLLEVLGDMSDGDRELIEKKYLGGWSYQALAEHFDVSEKAVESRLTRARTKLRERAIQRLNQDKSQ